MRSVHVFDFFAVKSSQATRWCLRSAGSALFDFFLCRQVESTRCCSRSAAFFISLLSIGIPRSFWILRDRRESSRQDGVWVLKSAVKVLLFLPSSRVKRQDAVRFFDFFAVESSCDGVRQSILWFLCCWWVKTVFAISLLSSQVHLWHTTKSVAEMFFAIGSPFSLISFSLSRVESRWWLAVHFLISLPSLSRDGVCNWQSVIFSLLSSRVAV